MNIYLLIIPRIDNFLKFYFIFYIFDNNFVNFDTFKYT